MAAPDSSGTSATPSHLPPIPVAAASVGSTASATPPQHPRQVLVPRPPLNIYLKIAVVRDANDAVVCEDVERPGKTKTMVVMDQLLDGTHSHSQDEGTRNVSIGRNSGGGSSSVAETSQRMLGDASSNIPPAVNPKEKNYDRATSRALNAASDSGNNHGHKSANKNKKEIPVPTITAVARYDRDVPPDYTAPSSFVRYVCPSREEVLTRVDYNLDAEDEAWWRDNRDFGPSAAVTIVMEGEVARAVGESGAPRRADGKVEEHGKLAREDAKPHISKNVKGRQINKRGQFVKRTPMKKINSDLSKDTAKYSENGRCGNNSVVEVGVTSSSRSSSGNNTPASPCTPRPTYTIQQVLALNPKYLYSSHSTHYLLRKYNPKMPLATFEHMMDALEKATAFDAIVTSAQAEEILVRRIPALVDLFGPLSERERRREEEEEERRVARWLERQDAGASSGRGSATVHARSSSSPLPTLGPPIALDAVIRQVHTYWLLKRSRLKRPLLRRYWPPTPAGDTNPHQVFRQPLKEQRRRLRKKKQNDVEAYQKMVRLKAGFEGVRALCELVVRREAVYHDIVEATHDYFEERLFGWTDTSGFPRRRGRVDQRTADDVLNLPKYFDDGPIMHGKGGKKRKRLSLVQANTGGRWNAPHNHNEMLSVPGSGGSQPSSAAPGTRTTNTPPGKTTTPTAAPAAVGPSPPPCPAVVAGHNGGLPVPDFLQPLRSRQAPTTTSWKDAVPFMPRHACDEATATGFRHRPRLGRGGRIIIDRVPWPSPSLSGEVGGASGGGGGGSAIGIRSRSPLPPPQTVITYGSGMARSGYDTATLGADGPGYSLRLGPEKGVSEINGDSTEGTDAAPGPKAPAAQQVLDLLPRMIDPTLLSRRIEEICALGLLEDNEKRTGVGISGGGGNTASTTAAAAAGSSVSVVSSSSAKGGGAGGGAGSSSAVATDAANLSSDMDNIF